MFWGIMKWGDISRLSEREKKLNLTKKCPWFFLQLEQVDEAASVTVICLDCRLCVSAVFCGRKRLMTFVCCTCRIYPHIHVEDHRSVSHILHQCFVTVEVRVCIFPAVNKDVTLVTSGCLWQLMRKSYGHLDKGEWLDFPFSSAQPRSCLPFAFISTPLLQLVFSPESAIPPFLTNSEKDPCANIAFSVVMEWDRNALTRGRGIVNSYIKQTILAETWRRTLERERYRDGREENMHRGTVECQLWALMLLLLFLCIAEHFIIGEFFSLSPPL